MKFSNVRLALLLLTAAACSSPDSDGGDDAPAEIDAAGDPDPDAAATAADAMPVGPRNTRAVGAWALTEDLSSCAGFTGGMEGTALTDDDQFLLVFNDIPPGGTTLQTICTFTDDSAFTCANISSTAQLGLCFAAGSINNIEGTITGTTFAIAGDGSGNASAQCPGGPQTCGPAVSTAAGTITP